MRRLVYHTARSGVDRDKILRQAPFCAIDNSQFRQWLGTGFYFWEQFLPLAKWWGNVHYVRRGEHYIIFSTIFNCNDRYILDLVSNTEQMNDIMTIVRELKSRPEFEDTTFSAQFIINFITTKVNQTYKAIRVYGHDSCSTDKNITQNKFLFNDRSYLNLCPEIQICVKDRKVLQLPMKIVYCSEDDPNNIVIA